MMRTLIFVASMAFLIGCKPRLFTNKLDTRMPIKIENATSQDPVLNWGKAAINDRGLLASTLVLSLDYISRGQQEAGQLPECIAPLTDDFGVIGKIICTHDTTLTASILPSHLRQECYTNADWHPTQPTKRLELKNCQQVNVLTFRYEPELRIDIEP